jgi:hypothetical protein
VAEPPDDELVREVFAHFGLAAYLAQVLERSLVTALSTPYGPGSTRVPQGELDQRFEDLAEKNPGALLNALGKAGLSAEVTPLVRAALEDRNRLVHRFLWDRAIEFTSVDGCRRMLADLAGMQQRFRECDAAVEAEVHQWAASHGITTEHVDAAHQAMLERGRVLSEAEINEVLGRRSTEADLR